MRSVELTTFGLLISFLILCEGQSDCNYYTNVQDDRSYYAYNQEYPNNYVGENYCTWQATSYNLQVNCTINMPQSSNCQNDKLLIQLDGKEYRYCGNNTFTIMGNNVTIKFSSPYNSKGGRFLCEMKRTARCYCGWKNPDRIVGGSETGVNEYPMMAGLVDGIEKELYCGATIISNQYVVTAAHCVFGRNISMIGVIVGEHDVSTGSETAVTRLYRIYSCTSHPNYSSPKSDYDIAICKINGTITYSPKVGPVCLPFQHENEPFINKDVMLLGWGMLEFGGKKSKTLQEVQVQTITNNQCKQAYGNEITDNNICTYTPGKDACQMDSGGPAIWDNKQTNNYVLIGIIVGGSGCATPNNPGVSTRLTRFLDWIESQTPGVQYCKVE